MKKIISSDKTYYLYIYLIIITLTGCSSRGNSLTSNATRQPASNTEGAQGPLIKLMKSYSLQGFETNKLIQIQGTHNTPTITIDAVSGVLSIKGRSIPENSIEFYKPLIDWLNVWTRGPMPRQVAVEINLSSGGINSVSVKIMLELLRKLTESNSAVTLNWYYEEDDQDMLKIGQELQSLIKAKVQLVSKPSGCSSREK